DRQVAGALVQVPGDVPGGRVGRERAVVVQGPAGDGAGRDGHETSSTDVKQDFMRNHAVIGPSAAPVYAHHARWAHRAAASCRRLRVESATTCRDSVKHDPIGFIRGHPLPSPLLTRTETMVTLRDVARAAGV